MRLNRRQFLGGAATVAGAAALSGCGGGGSGGGNVLNVSACNHPWSNYIKDLLPEFEEEHDVKVQLNEFQADQLSTMYSTRLSANATDLDVMMYRPLQEGVQFMRNEWLLDLDASAAGDTAYDLADFQEAAMEVVKVDSAVYGIPIVTEREVLFYRKDLLDVAGISVPETMEDLEDAAEMLTDPASGVFGIAMRGQKAAAVTQFSGFLYSYGADFMTESGEASIDTPEAIAAYTMYGDLLRNYGPEGVESMSTEQINPLFQQGKIAMFIDAEVFWSELIREGTSTVAADQLGVAPLPAGPAGSKPYSVPSWALAVNAKTTKADLSWEFVKWATSPDMVLAAQQAGVSGARTSVWENPDSLTGIPEDFQETLRVSTENGVGYDRPRVVQVGRARDIVGEPLIAAIRGEDVTAAAQTAQANFAAFLEEDATATGE
ncbi:ABC transporter substrate-binding protein [Brachybacterium massiliense]|uniref:ABC transporter substrate-binding protein n=1 Tax=Brachybacterium massiliense TaxID=1755098 RepID=UPI000B3BC757|nr:sugar ABC transporter substrate-binding protein [Brachybacterium massiliense]